MLTRIISVCLLAAVGAVAAVTMPSPPLALASPDAVTAHEWGTFTTVAGQDGRATQWLPLDGPTDLPCFVEHFRDLRLFKIGAGVRADVAYAAARSQVLGKVRMETPVIYFYAPREQTVDVRVRFPRGWVTEWYPRAAVSQPQMRPANGVVTHTGTIQWKNVTIAPSARVTFPTGDGDARSHYYLARNTGAAPLRVGNQYEKFLFYRGVGDFDVPLAATALADGSVHIANLATAELPAVVLFEKRGTKVGYRVHGALRGEVTLSAPSLDGSLDRLKAELERTLIETGLYQREAAAMVETWSDSWFEDGVRVFYVLPRASADEILPLDITPRPANVVRTFVGRMEVITPAIEKAVASAIARNDERSLATYGRFLGPATERIVAKTSDVAVRTNARIITERALARYVRRAMVCE